MIFFYHFDFQTLIYSVAKVIVSLMRFQLRDAFSKTVSIDIIETTIETKIMLYCYKTIIQ